MRSFWSRVPMLRLVFALAAGITSEILADHFGMAALAIKPVVAVMLASLLFIFATGLVKNASLSFRLRFYTGFSLHITLIAFGFILAWFYTQKNYADNYANYITGKQVIVAEITEPPVIRDKVVMVNGTVKEVKNENGNFETDGNIQLTFLRDSICELLQYGNVLLVKSKIDTTEGPKNPGEFNFKQYQAYRNVYHKAFVTKGDWCLIDTNAGNSLLAGIYKLRSKFLAVITRYVSDKNDFGVASAIMLGYRDYINSDIMRAYASSGTVHILSVSGLHVSIMFFMLNFLLSWMDKRGRRMVYLKAVTIIIFIWFYACLTGLSPPVLRSAMMFTLIQVGQVLIRNVNTYNIIAGSALLLMLFNPFVITDVGFQLSYIAVFGIVYLQPKIAGLWIIKLDKPHFKNADSWWRKAFVFLKYDGYWFSRQVLNFFWQLIAASIAAQIATLPLCLFYFYQFPNLFLLSNLVVIPLSNLLLFSGTVMFGVAHIPYVSDVAGWFFTHLLSLLDKFIFWIDTLPFALTQGISISVMEVIFLYILIVLLCWLSEERKNKVLMASLGIVLVLCSFGSYKEVKLTGQKHVVVYAVSKQKAIAFISGKSLYYDFDSALVNNQPNMLFHIYHHWWDSGVNKEASLTTSGISSAEIQSTTIPQGKLVLFEGKKILIVDSLSTSDYNGTRQRLKVDLVILSGTLKVSLPVLRKSILFDEVVFNSACKPASRKRWKKDCVDLNINYWDVNAQGAFVWNLNKEMP